MAFEALVTIIVIIVALVLFTTSPLPAELVAFLIMTTLMLTGVVTPEEGVSGFSHPATLTILGLFVISAGIYRSGIITLLARRLALVTGTSEPRMLIAFVLIVGPLSAFINNTAAVAILIPLALTLARESATSPSKLLIPLSFLSMLAGTITLIGTSTNIIASTILNEQIGRGFTMFEFTPVGLVVFATGALYMLFVGRHLIPERIPVGEAGMEHLLKDFVTEVRIRPTSPLVGKTLKQHRMRERHRVDVIRIIRDRESFDQPVGDVRLRQGDVLLLRGPRERLARLEGEAKVEILAGVKQEDVAAGTDAHVVEVIVSPSSSLVRRTVTEAAFAQAFDVKVLGIRQHGPAIFRRLGSTRLNFGDSLLVLATPQAVNRLRADPDFIIGEDVPVEQFQSRKMIVAVGILAGVVTVSALDVYPILVAALTGAVLMVVTRVLRTHELWTSVRWDVIFILAGMIPLGIALENTGLAATIGNGIAMVALRLPDLGVIMTFYLASSILTEMVSNNATIILLGPIAFATAGALAVNPIPLILAAMFAASTSFLTPIGYQTNLMVYGPGEYKFTDFARVGAPLNLILLVVTSYTISVFFPLR